MLGVDRLDMIKGITQKILAFEKFLEENPYLRDRVVLFQIAVPTRTDVPEYQKPSSQVDEIMGRINGRFGTLTIAPIHHLVKSGSTYHSCCVVVKNMLRCIYVIPGDSVFEDPVIAKHEQDVKDSKMLPTAFPTKLHEMASGLKTNVTKLLFDRNVSNFSMKPPVVKFGL